MDLIIAFALLGFCLIALGYLWGWLDRDAKAKAAKKENLPGTNSPGGIIV